MACSGSGEHTRGKVRGVGLLQATVASARDVELPEQRHEGAWYTVRVRVRVRVRVEVGVRVGARARARARPRVREGLRLRLVWQCRPGLGRRRGTDAPG